MLYEKYVTYFAVLAASSLHRGHLFPLAVCLRGVVALVHNQVLGPVVLAAAEV